MQRGFTLIEIILSISLISLLLGVTAPVALREFQRTALRNAQNNVEQAILTAQTRAASGYLADDWGVEITATNTVMYKGNTYATRDNGYDLFWGLPSSITPSGTSSFIFNHTSFGPSSPGTTTLSSTNGDALYVYVSADGVIELE